MPEDWLPNHLLVIHVLVLFAVLNPLVVPFGLIYFLIEQGTGFCVGMVVVFLMPCPLSCRQEPIITCVCKEL
jgi:hypothetical protein